MEQHADEAQDYMTPPQLLEPARLMGGGKIALDPCGTKSRHDQVRARVKLIKGGTPDYFSADWVALARGGLVFVNPEYSDMDTWGGKLLEEARRGAEVVALLPARTDAAWWHAMAKTYAARVELEGRVQFLDPRTGKRATALDRRTGKRRPSSGKFPSAVIYFGHRPQLFLRWYGNLGEPLLPERVRRAAALMPQADAAEAHIRDLMVAEELERNGTEQLRRVQRAQELEAWRPSKGLAQLHTDGGRLLAGVRTLTGTAQGAGPVILELEAPPGQALELRNHMLGFHGYLLVFPAGEGAAWRFRARASSAGPIDGDRLLVTLHLEATTVLKVTARDGEFVDRVTIRPGEVRRLFAGMPKRKRTARWPLHPRAAAKVERMRRHRRRKGGSRG